MNSGRRRDDAARVGCPHVREGRIRIETEKTGREVTIRILPPLATSIAASPVGDVMRESWHRKEAEPQKTQL